MKTKVLQLTKNKTDKNKQVTSVTKQQLVKRTLFPYLSEYHSPHPLYGQVKIRFVLSSVFNVQLFVQITVLSTVCQKAKRQCHCV